MKDTLARSFTRYSTTFSGFTAAQKVIAVLGSGALVLAGVLVFKWVAQPQYAPLFSNMSPSDASAVVDKLDADGTPYKLTGSGTTVMVPKDDVYAARIKLSGEGLPSASDGGYDILDKAKLGTSQAQENTNFKRAMEGELAKTIEAMDGVNSAVVHLALPEKQVFADKQADPTGSVLVSTSPGKTLSPEQVQAIVHIVASSIDGMQPENVTVADSTGKLLTGTDGTDGAMASTQTQLQAQKQQEVQSKVQAMLDRVLGPGNSTVQVAADIDFDKSTIEKKTYAQPLPNKGLSTSYSKSAEKYANGTAAGTGGTASGVVGPDGQMDPSTNPSTVTGSANGGYSKTSETADPALDETHETRIVTPGAIKKLNVSYAIDQAVAANTDPAAIQKMVETAAGIDKTRGDTVTGAVLKFDRTTEATAAKEIKAQDAVAAKAGRMDMYRNIALGALVFLALVIAWLRGRKKTKQRQQATNYVVEHLKAQPAELEPPAVLSLEASKTPEDEIREELTALVESQPEDVAALLRGWLVER